MDAHCSYILELADDHLILGHRLSEWCGHGPILEEDIALANIALDCIGLAKLCYEEAGKRLSLSADELVFFRSAREYRNCQLVEQPNGDFGKTILRQFFFDAYSSQLFQSLSTCPDQFLAAIGAKAAKECTYHLRHSSSWVIRLGDGTEESKQRIDQAVKELWPYVKELFCASAAGAVLVAETSIKSPATFETQWQRLVQSVGDEATLSFPALTSAQGAPGRNGEHTEHLESLLDIMQSTARAHPGVTW